MFSEKFIIPSNPHTVATLVHTLWPSVIYDVRPQTIYPVWMFVFLSFFCIKSLHCFQSDSVKQTLKKSERVKYSFRVLCSGWGDPCVVWKYQVTLSYLPRLFVFRWPSVTGKSLPYFVPIKAQTPPLGLLNGY